MEKKWKYSSQTCRYIVHDKTFWFVSVTLYPWTSPRLLSGYCHRSVESAWKQKTWSILLLKKHSGLFFHFFWNSRWSVVQISRRSQQVDCNFRLRDYYDTYSDPGPSQCSVYSRKLWELLDERLHDFTDLKRQLSCGSDDQSADLQETPVKPPQRIYTSVLTSIYEIYRRVSSSPASSSASLPSSAAVLWWEWQKRASFRSQLPAVMRQLVSWSDRSGPITTIRNQRAYNFHVLYLSNSIFCYFILPLQHTYLMCIVTLQINCDRL